MPLSRGCYSYCACSVLEVGSKEAKSVTMNISSTKKYFLFKSFLKVEFSYVFTINMPSTAENCKEK